MTAVMQRFRPLITAVRVALALVAFAFTRRTPFYPYVGMRQMHVMTRGGSTRFLAALLSKRVSPGSDDDCVTEGLLGRLEHDEVQRLAQRVREDGFVTFAATLSSEVCAELEKFARETPARLMPPVPGQGPVTYDPKRPLATRYDFDEQQLLATPVVQRVLFDPSLRVVAEAYLQAVPINDMVSMWWTAPHGGVSSAAAQMFHYDLDRPRFLKFFFYLTDVTSETGPHVFVQGSHVGRPDPFYEDRRFTDEEVLEAYSGDSVRELGGRRGTILAVDTSGLHKGKHPDRGDRLVLQLEFAVTLFGAKYERFAGFKLEPEAADEAARAPLTYQRFLS